MGETVELPAEELKAMRAELGAITRRLNEVFAFVPAMPADAVKANAARIAARARGFFWTEEFAAVIGHHKQFVSDRCASRVIKVLPGGKPYRIPLTEEAKWNGLN